MKHAIKATTGLTLGTAGWLTVAPVVQAVCLRGLRSRFPELFDGAAALRAVLAAIDQDIKQGSTE